MAKRKNTELLGGKNRLASQEVLGKAPSLKKHEGMPRDRGFNLENRIKAIFRSDSAPPTKGTTTEKPAVKKEKKRTPRQTR